METIETEEINTLPAIEQTGLTAENPTKEPEEDAVKKFHYEDLTPVDSVPEDAPYDGAIQWALENPNVKNIALTGPYGSGKSSVLRTFEKNHPQYTYLNISLASFKEENPAVPGVVKTKEQLNEESRLIELSIIQQMFYKVSDSAIPDSRFKRIKSLPQSEINVYIQYSLMAFLAFIILFRPKFLLEMSLWRNLMACQEDLIYIIAILLLVPGSKKLLNYIFRVFNGSRFNKLNLASGEIEINPKSEASILNKHLDEILYFFEVTPFDVVVIEDLDRFNDPEIFTKLRELNILINNSDSIARRVRFIYAVKDDMFKDKSRTKFFDFIVPVIPVINSTNSLDIMLKKIDKPELKLEISENFLSDITLYIDDMRALKNIFNEFLIYKENLKAVKIKQEKLFAIIVYKNIHPDDFAKLHENKGEVYLAFESKTSIIETITKEKNEQIISLQKETVTIHNASRLKVDELRKLYVFGLITMVPTASAVSIDGVRIEWTELIKEENFLKLTQQTNISCYQTVYGYSNERLQNTSIPFKNVEDAVDPEFTYLQRLKQLTDRENNTIGMHRESIERIKQEINELKQQPLRNLLETIPNAIDIIGENFRKMKLIVYLIREGYIDEMYPSLISHFYAGSLSFKDMEFIMSIKDREALPFNYQLEKTQTLCKRLTPAEFGRQEIFNVNLVDVLILGKGTHAEKWNRFVGQFAEPSEIAIDFIDDYTTSGKQAPKFMAMLCKQWPRIAASLLYELDLSDEKRERFLKLIILHCELADVIKLDVDDSLSQFMSEKANFVSLFTEKQFPKVQQVIKKLDVRFENLTYQVDTESELLDWILDNNQYRLNPAMVWLYFHTRHTNDEKLIEQLETANYTSIKQSADKKIIDYIELDIENYVEDVMLELDSNTQESEASVMSLLNNPKLNDELKTSIIETQTVKLKDISKVAAPLYHELLENLMAEANWANVLTYYQQSEGFDAVLEEYINTRENYELLSKSWFSNTKGLDKTIMDKFSVDFLLDENLSDAAFSEITRNYGFFYNNAISIKTISEKRMLILINNSVVRLTVANFNLFKEQFGTAHIHLLEKNNAEYFKDITPYTLISIDYTLLLSSNQLTSAQKNILAAKVDSEMIEETNQLGGQMTELISKNPFAQTSYALLLSMFAHSSNTLEKAIIFDRGLMDQDFGEIEPLLKLIGDPYIKLTEKHKSPKLEVNTLNWSIAEKLRQRGYVSSIKEEKGKIRVNTKH